MKKILLSIIAILTVAVLFTGCSEELLVAEKLNISDINKIQIITAMDDHEEGADSKFIIEPEEIQRFVDTFNSAVIGNEVADESLDEGNVSYYYFYNDEELLALFTFYENDTNIILHNDRFHHVQYDRNLKTPFELYQESDVEVFVVDEHGNILEIPKVDEPVDPGTHPSKVII